MNNDAARFTGNVPEYYDEHLGPVIFADFADDIARRVAALDPKRVLETAAGTGIVARRLRDRLAAGATLSITDLNAPMLEITRKKFRPAERVAFLAANAVALPFSDAVFDAVVCQFGVMFFPDKRASYAEVYRVLMPGGTYVFNVWDSHENNAFGRITHDTVASFFPDDPPQFQRVPFSYHSVGPIAEDLKSAGFVGVQSTVVRIDKTLADAAAFARGLIFGSPLLEQINARGSVEPESVVAALTGALQREFGADPGRMSLQAIVFSAGKPA